MLCRRQVVAGLCATLAGLPRSAFAQDDIPFCSFSAARGWSERRTARTIYSRRAYSGDRSGIPQVVGQIERAVGFRADVQVFITNGREGNAYATTSGRRRLLIVDTDFLVSCNTAAGTEWAAVQVVAHELGHFIAGFDDTAFVKELNADYWSGYALRRLDCPRETCSVAVDVYGSETDTMSHPNKHSRRESILSGWDDAHRNAPNYERCSHRCG